MTTLVHSIQSGDRGFDFGAAFPEDGKAAAFQQTIFDRVPMAPPRSGSENTLLPPRKETLSLPGFEAASSWQEWDMSAIRLQRSVQLRPEVSDNTVSTKPRRPRIVGYGNFLRGVLPPTDELRKSVTSTSGGNKHNAAADPPRHGMEYYGSKFLESLLPANIRISSRQIAESLADLIRQSGIEGYEALRSHFMEKGLSQRLYTLSAERMRGLAWLKDANNQDRQAILLTTADILSKGRDGHVPSEGVIESQSTAARTLLDFIGQFAQDGVLYKTEYRPWRKSVLGLIKASNHDDTEKIHAALQDMWQSDFLHEDVGTRRTDRLKRYVEFLAPKARYALARMLGVVKDTRAVGTPSARTFAKFEAQHLFPSDTDPIMPARTQEQPEIDTPIAEARKRGQRITDAAIFAQKRAYIARLGDVLKAVIAQDPDKPVTISLDVSDSRPVPASCRSGNWITILKNKLDHWNSTGHIYLTTRFVLHDLAQESLIRDDRARDLLYRDMLNANGMVQVRYSMAPKVIDGELASMNMRQVATIRHNLHIAEVAANEAREEQDLFLFFPMLKKAVAREEGVRLAAAALARMRTALPERDKPDLLLQALNELATAHCLAPSGESESEFYKWVFHRAGSDACEDLRKELKNSDGWMSRAEAVSELIPSEEVVVRTFHTRQLEVLAGLL